MDALRLQHQRLQTRHEELKQQHQALVAERERLVHEHKEMQNARELALRESAELRNEVSRLEGLLRDAQQPSPAQQQHAQENARLHEHIRQLKAERHTADDERAQLQAEIAQLRAERAEEGRRYAQLQEKLTQLEDVRAGRVAEHSELVEKVARLEGELASYREQSKRTNKLFAVATRYAESVREEARHEAEATLRKARVHAEELVRDHQRKRHQIERELVQVEVQSRTAQEDLLRLQERSRATQRRLTAALGVLAEVEGEQEDAPAAGAAELRGSEELQDALKKELASIAEPAPPSPLTQAQEL